MIARILASAMVAAVMTGSVTGAEFAYSVTSGPSCTNVGSKREFNSWRCPGPAGYSTRFSDLGNMVAVEFGPKGREKAIVEDGLVWQGADKAFSEKLEWRLSGPKLYAAILRIWRQDFDEKANLPQVIEELLVIKISAQGACRMGSVDARRAEANTIARNLADASAASFRCGIDQPSTIGVPSAGGS